MVVLLVMGVRARAARREPTLSDYFLAGRSIGLAVLFLTLFATQYSGNTVSAFPGQTYREGLSAFMTVPIMIGIVTGYTLFAPRLSALGRAHGFVTPTDYLAYRFDSPALNYVSAGIFAFTLANFLLAQLTALGHAFSGVTLGRIPYGAAVVAGALVILIYELLGGMRAVAWTDAFQGVLLLAGLAALATLVSLRVGGPAELVAAVAGENPEKISNPTLSTCVYWISNFLLLFLGAPLYPQAIQRFFAARRLAELRRALVMMAVIPLFAVTAVVFVGLAGLALFPALQPIEADQVTFRVLAHLVESTPHAHLPALVVMVGVVAAIMSTADSVLLSLSSVFTKDFAARLKGLSPEAAERYLRPAPIASVAIMLALTLLALRPRTTLWGLLVIKFEVLIQLSPAFVLGTLHQPGDPRGFRVGDVLVGLTAGLAATALLYATGHAELGGLHAGTAGVAVNYIVTAGSRWLRLAGRWRA